MNTSASRISVLVASSILVNLCVQADPPLVTNVRASQRAGTQIVDIRYDVTDPDSPIVTVFLAISADAGAKYNVPVHSLSGDHGPGVAVGLDRHIIWDAGVDWAGNFSDQCRARVIADDGSGPPAPSDMVLIPYGPFNMGDPFFEGDLQELPVHTVEINSFFIDRYEVDRELWLDVFTWAIGREYNFSTGGTYSGVGHPVRQMTWYDAVKWCNARSEKAGLTPVYYTDVAHTTVYRSGNSSLSNEQVDWTANGYRLPTEAEWEKAARGGVPGLRYPWGDDLDGKNANFFGSGDAFEQGGSTTPVGYFDGTQTPEGDDMANGYGLYDMIGNVAEWCWDRFASTSYSQPWASEPDPRGPTSGDRRVLRGGAFNNAPSTMSLRISARGSFSPVNSVSTAGFRCVRGF